jgi:hypothetical protein
MWLRVEEMIYGPKERALKISFDFSIPILNFNVGSI